MAIDPKGKAAAIHDVLFKGMRRQNACKKYGVSLATLKRWLAEEKRTFLAPKLELKFPTEVEPGKPRTRGEANHAQDSSAPDEPIVSRQEEFETWLKKAQMKTLSMWDAWLSVASDPEFIRLNPDGALALGERATQSINGLLQRLPSKSDDGILDIEPEAD